MTNCAESQEDITSQKICHQVARKPKSLKTKSKMKIQLLSEGAQAPKRVNEFAAGHDLYVPKDTIIYPGRNIIPLDFKIALDPGTVGTIKSRSGFAVKGMEAYAVDQNNKKIGDKLRINADVERGDVDEDYRGVVGVIVKNHCEDPYLIEKGTRIAQMIITKYEAPTIEFCESLEDTERGEGGYGHTGTK